MEWKSISFWIGILIVVSTHVAMLFDKLPMVTNTQRYIHAVANLVAAVLILYGSF